MRKRSLPEPEKFTVRDAIQILFGVIMIPLGAVILMRTWSSGAPLPALLIASAFTAFGVYRTLFAWGRIRWYLATRGADKGD